MIDIDQVQTLSAKDNVPRAYSALKLMEEAGELAAAFLATHNTKNKSASADSNVLEEGVDVIMCALDVLFKHGYTQHSIQEMLNQKCDKWDRKMNPPAPNPRNVITG